MAATANQAPSGTVAAQPKIVSRNVTKIYPTARGPMVAVDDFSLDVAEGEFVCIVGPSGCGKSTYLRILAGLDTLSSGTIFVNTSRRPRYERGRTLRSAMTVGTEPDSSAAGNRTPSKFPPMYAVECPRNCHPKTYPAR